MSLNVPDNIHKVNKLIFESVFVKISLCAKSSRIVVMCGSNILYM